MAIKTNLQLKTSLVGLWGYEEVSDLTTQEQADIQTFVNQALFECYAPVDGTRPNYGEQYWSAILPAPVVTTLGVTNGSKVVTGHTFLAAHAGSNVLIGQSLYRYAGLNGSDHELVQPWQGDTGTVSATVFHNAVALPGTVLEIASEHPEILGVGLLSPLPGPQSEVLIRSEAPWDFTPGMSSYPFGLSRLRFDLSQFLDEDEPLYYHIDSATTAPTFTAPVNRLHVYPMPDAAYTVSMRASFLPAALSDDEDTPPMPFQAVDNILLPIAREKLVENSAGRRFTGNVKLIQDAAERARAHLKSLTKPQRYQRGGFALRAGW
tara:strand:- start:253 stop:1215 length:963 start_codon:yes stop_codon:yes gene_type:complete